MSLVTGTFEKQAPGRVILLCFGAKHFAFKVPLYNSGMEMFNSKFSGKPKEMLLCDEPGSHPRKEVGGKKVISGTPCHFMLKKQG